MTHDTNFERGSVVTLSFIFTNPPEDIVKKKDLPTKQEAPEIVRSNRYSSIIVGKASFFFLSCGSIIRLTPLEPQSRFLDNRL